VQLNTLSNEMQFLLNMFRIVNAGSSNSAITFGYVSCSVVCFAALAALSATAILVIVVTSIVWAKDLIRLTLRKVSEGYTA
jgi:hypothetical protein